MTFRGLRLLLVGIVLLFPRSTFAQQYTVTDLDTPTGFQSAALAINTNGQVVGYWGGFNAALWDRGVRQDLGARPEFGNCLANGINDMGQVVGACLSGVFTSRAFLWTADTGMTDLGTPDGSDNWKEIRAYGIANTGDIVGFVQSPGVLQSQAFVYRGGAFQVFPETDSGAIARGVNDSGQIVGCCIGTNWHAALWDDAGSHDLGALADLSDPGTRQQNSSALAVNAWGLVVGSSYTGDGVQGDFNAVMWTPYGIANLGTLGGPRAAAQAINGNLVVGYSETAQGIRHAFLYDNNGPGYPVDLNDLIPADSGWVLEDATGINAAGQIAGSGRLRNGFLHAVLLTPVQPATTPR